MLCYFTEHDLESSGLVEPKLEFDQRGRNETHKLRSTSNDHGEDGLTWLNVRIKSTMSQETRENI